MTRARTAAFADAPNLNALWSRLIVEELVRNGMSEVAVCPGSRSTPLTIACVEHPDLNVTVVTDERAAAYFALGVARASGVLAAVVTTSGTAVSNLFPAVTEADADQVPVLLLTADRPAELRDTAANQSIPQGGIFGERVRWAIDFPCPDEAVSPAFVLTSIDAAVRYSADGPVHVNLPFREPLAPTPRAWDAAILAPLERWLGATTPFTSGVAGSRRADDSALGEWMNTQPTTNGLIVVAGEGSVGDPDAKREAITELTAATGWPVMCDIRSGLRLGWSDQRSLVAGHLDALDFAPSAVWQLGRTITSKPIAAVIGAAPSVTVVAPTPRRIDPEHRVTHRIEADPIAFARQLAAAWRAAPSAPALDAAHVAAERALEGAMGDAFDEPSVARHLSRAVAPGHGLFVGSSLPVRLLDTFAAIDGPPLPVSANRGASGIDGTIASAIGFARGLARPVTALIGDLTALHDLASLPLLRRASPPVTLVILNNGGGGIFRLLPIREHREVFEEYFATRHEHRFDRLTGAFDIPYRAATSRATLEHGYTDLRDTGGILEVIVDPDETIRSLATYHDAVRSVLT
jgi:2-succinyl-5-enolpyruvyl-6-hydroxy-3-cyclohexene-1-carboxylate synthase